MAGAGWSKPFTGTGIAVFKQGPGGNNRFLRVWNASGAPDSYGYFAAYMRGYENMTAVSSGAGLFPTTAQITGNGMYTPYRSDILGNQQNWILRATSSWFDLVVDANPENSETGMARIDHYCSFGNFPSFKSGDTFNEYISAGSTTGSLNGMHTFDGEKKLFVTRSDTGTGGSISGNYLAAANTSESYLGSGSPGVFAYPNRPDSTVPLHQYMIYADGQIRGTSPGLWGTVCGGDKIGPGNTFDGQGTTAGRKFLVRGPVASTSYPILEITDTFTGL